MPSLVLPYPHVFIRRMLKFKENILLIEMNIYGTGRQFVDKTKQRLKMEFLLHELPLKIKFYIIKGGAHILEGS